MCETGAILPVGPLSWQTLHDVYGQFSAIAPVYGICLQKLILCTIIPVPKRGDFIHHELTPVVGPTTLRKLYNQGSDRFGTLVSELKSFSVSGEPVRPASAVCQRWYERGQDLCWMTLEILNTKIDACLWVC